MLSMIIACQREVEPTPLAGPSEEELQEKRVDKESWWERTSNENDDLAYTTDEYESAGIYMEDAPGTEGRITRNSGEADATVASSILDYYRGCGFSEAPPQEAITPPFEASIDSTVTKLSGFNAIAWQITATSSMSMNGTTESTTIEVGLDIIDGTPSRAEARAESEAANYENETTFFNTTPKATQEALNRGSNPSCGVMMADKVEIRSENGGTYINATFSKPFPYMLSPQLSAPRALRELESPITIDGIEATVETNDPNIKWGSSPRVGSATISLINPKRSVTDSNNKTISFHSDYAYRVASKFEGSSSVWWLDQVSDYYIKDGEIIGIVTQIPKRELNILVYEN